MKLQIFITQVLLIAITFIPIIQCVDHPEIQSHTFCYKNEDCDPSTWGGECQTGREQSPIDIPDSATKTSFYMNSDYLNLQLHKFYGQNNGHTAQFELVPNLTELRSHLYIAGGGLPGKYVFAQMHFHWGEVNSTAGSEHTIKGERYPLELHLVHYNKKYSSLRTALASNDRDALAVMAVLFKLGKSNPDLEPIIQALSLLEAPGKVTEFSIDLTVSTLYPERKRKFARYMGSLTTPTCDEKVIWTVFMHPRSLSLEQMERFWHVRNQEGTSSFNFRPTQPLLNREIQYYEADDFTDGFLFRKRKFNRAFRNQKGNKHMTPKNK